MMVHGRRITPYTNSIRDVDDLVKFMLGEYSIIIISDYARGIEIAEKLGWKVCTHQEAAESLAKVMPKNIDNQRSIYNFKSEDGIFSGISDIFYSRIFFEFISPEWLISSACESFRNPEVIEKLSGIAGDAYRDGSQEKR